MLQIFKDIPTTAYFAVGIVSAAAAYVFYTPSFLKQKLNGSHKKYPRGLINQNNDCYLNVILQSLAASKKVSEWLVTNRPVISLVPSTNILFNTLSNVIASINRLELNLDKETVKSIDLKSDQTDFYAAYDIKKALNAHNWHIRSEEHDCHELFHLLIDVIDEEQDKNNTFLNSLNYFQSSSIHSKESQAIANHTLNPFHGYLISQLECLDCLYKYPLRLEKFYSLSLMIPQNQINLFTMKSSHYNSCVSLYECINNYFKPEHIAEMKCENCCGKQNENEDSSCSSKKPAMKLTTKKGFIKRQAIAKLPECLCIHLQRNSWSESGYGMVKKTEYVKFPLSLRIDDPKSVDSNMASFSLSSSNSSFSMQQVGIGGLLNGKSSIASKLLNNQDKRDRPIKADLDPKSSVNKSSYELKSAIVHFGNENRGHFVAYRKPLKDSNSDSWLQISDNYIKNVKTNTLLSSNVYMLFYDKVQS